MQQALSLYITIIYIIIIKYHNVHVTYQMYAYIESHMKSHDSSCRVMSEFAYIYIK